MGIIPNDRLVGTALGDAPIALEVARLLMACAFGIPGQEDDAEEG